MNRTKLGAKLRIARLRLGLRQVDVAARIGVSDTTVSRAERGDFGHLSIDLFERIADAVEMWFDGDLKSRSGVVDRLMNAAHAELTEQVVTWVNRQTGWLAAAEVSFAIGRESGVIDILAFHEATGTVSVIELKTTIVDPNEHLGKLHQKRRLAVAIARTQGWSAQNVSVWLIVSESTANRRKVARCRGLLRSQLPADGRQLAAAFRRPGSPVAGLAFWANSHRGQVGRETTSRMRAPGRRRTPDTADRRSDGGDRRV